MSCARASELAHADVCDCHDRASTAAREAVQAGSPIQRSPEAARVGSRAQ